MKYIRYIGEGFAEVIGLLPLALILHLLLSTSNSPMFNLPSLVNVKPSMTALIYLIYAIYSIVAFVVIKKKFNKSIKNSKTLSVKAVGWVFALIVIIFIFDNQLFNNLEVILEVLIWLIVVGMGNLIAYYKIRRGNEK